MTELNRRKPSPYELIKHAIVDGTFEPGAPLVESTVARWCGVSRTPIREALTRLEQDGLVERGDRGLIVCQRSPEEILDIYEVRIVLEATAAHVAAERHTSFDRMRLQGLLRVDRTSGATEPTELARSNREFHSAVWRASHNEALVDLLGRLDLHLMRYPETTLSYPGRWKSALEEHQSLVEAIINHDGLLAAEIAERHFTAARDIRLALWEQDTA